MEQVANVEACRLCANFFMTGAEVDFVDLFQPIAGLEAQLEFIRTQLNAWQLRITPNDELPQRICANCFAQLCNIQTFRQQCEEAQHKLFRSYGKSDETNKLVEEPAATANQAQPPQQEQGRVMDATESFVELAATIQQTGGVAELMNVLKNIDSLETLQPATTTSADVIASLNEMQLPPVQQLSVSVAASLATYTDYATDYTTMQNNSLLESCNTMITTNAPLDTTTEQTDVLRFAPTISSENNFYANKQQLATTTDAQSNGVKEEVDLEDMLEGSIIPKKGLVDENVSEAEAEQCVERLRLWLKDPVENSCAFGEFDEQSGSEYEDGEDIELDVPEGTARLTGNPFACQYCYCPTMGSINHLVFSSADALSQHFFDVHDPNLPYTCPYCSQKYSSLKQRDYHVRLMHRLTTRPEHCKYCRKTLRSSTENHQLNCTYVGNWRCDTCGDRFEGVPLHRFRTHQRQHDTARQFRCKICSRMFIRRANLEAHERMHRIQEATMIRCDECKSVFSCDYELRRHKYQTHSGELPVKCGHCGKGFVSMAFLTRHMQHFHPGQFDNSMLDAATCVNCGTIFDSMLKLRNHVQRQRDENGKCIDTWRNGYGPRVMRQRQQVNNACPHCAKRFLNKQQLTKHLSTHEARLRPFQCEQCPQRCATMTELRQHITTMHSTYLQCQCCVKCYATKQELSAHMLTHTEQNYQCTVVNCDYVATSERELKDHVRTKHRLIPCEYCGDLFTRQRLSTHLRNAHRTEIDVVAANTAQELEDSMAVDSILNEDVKISNGLVSSFEENMLNGEKVRVELLNSADTISSLVVQEQPSNSYKSLLAPSDTTDMENHFFMGSLLDPDHEIIVT